MSFEYTCDHCGKIYSRRTRVKSKRTFCSTNCYHEHTKTGGYVVCEHCGKSVYRPKTRIKRGERFCSVECVRAANEVQMITKICPKCAKEFQVPPSISDRYTVCSWECRTKDKRGYTCTCETCGKVFEAVETRWRQRFCSVACYRRSQSETHLEATIRHALTTLGIDFIQEAKVGRYSVDFLIPDGKIALEADGEYWHQDPKRDKRKTNYLARYGWTTIRVREQEVKDSPNVCDLIVNKLSDIPEITVDFIQPPLFEVPYEIPHNDD